MSSAAPDPETLLRRANRERAARKQAEQLLEQKSLQLFGTNQELVRARDELEQRVVDRTRELADANRALTEAKEHAEAANHAKSAFLANMSHEIRTPLTAILGYTDLITDPEEDADVQRAAAGVIARNGKHLLALVNDILDLSKLEAGQMTVERLPVTPRDILQQVDELMRPRAEGKGIELFVSCDTAVPDAIESDPTRLRQTLMNVIGNAVKFTDSGQVRVRCAAEGEHLDFVVEDSGIGIPEDRIDSIFESFSQADETTTRRFGGTGLGLPISRRLARLLGGDLTATSIPGQGSRFTIRVAGRRVAHTVSPAASSGGDAPSVDIHGVRVLYAEDGEDNQHLVSHVLGRAGCELEIVENGELALEAADPTRHDIILLDMQMPVMDGYTAARELRKRGVQLPIIAMTANAMSTDRQLCLDAGCDDYVSKPIDFALLRQTIGTLVSRPQD